MPENPLTPAAVCHSATDRRLHRLVRRMILRSFPRLRRHNVQIAWGLDDDLLSYDREHGADIIRVNDSFKEAPSRVLEGGIAHELCHAEADIKLSPFQRESAWRRYSTSVWARTREERATEERVIELGYGPQLLAFVQYARRLGYSFGREHGLIEPEIRRAIRSRQTGARPAASPPGRLPIYRG